MLAGIVNAIGTLSMFWWELEQDSSLAQAQTVALTTMVIFQMFHVGNARSDHRSVFAISPFSNPFLLLATGASFLVHVLALYLPATQFVLRVEPIPLDAWIRFVAIALSIIMVVELHKLLRRPVHISIARLRFRSHALSSRAAGCHAAVTSPPRFLSFL